MVQETSLKKHILPLPDEISSATIENYSNHHREITLILNDFLLKYLNSLYAEFNGDIVQAIVLGEVAHHNVSRLLNKGRIHSSVKPDNSGFDAIKHLLVPCNPFSISEATGIPRETVRRKFSELIDAGMIEQISPRGYIITALVSERYSFGFNVRLFEGLRTLCNQIQAITKE